MKKSEKDFTYTHQHIHIHNMLTWIQAISGKWTHNREGLQRAGDNTDNILREIKIFGTNKI
jgi:hypothetical protein